MKFETTPCRVAAIVFEKLSADVKPDLSRQLIAAAKSLREIPIPLDTEQVTRDRCVAWGEELSRWSLTLAVIGHHHNLAELKIPGIGENVRQEMLANGILQSAETNGMVRNCSILGDQLGELSVRLIDLQVEANG